MLVLATLAAAAAAAAAAVRAERGLTFTALGPEGEVEGRLAQTFRSQPVVLGPGEILLTGPEDTPMAMPRGDIAVAGLSTQVVDAATGAATPLSEVYMHHVLFFAANNSNSLCPESNFIFGAGAESRNTPIMIPHGHAYKRHEGAEWAASVHVLRTGGLSTPMAVKQCVECWWSPGKCDEPDNGTFACCGECEGSPSSPSCNVCSGAEASALPKEYAIEYTVYFERETAGVEAIAPAKVVTLTAPECDAFYAVLEDPAKPERLDTMVATAEHSGELLYAVGHQHIGGINATLYINGEEVCASRAVYGTQDGVPGNEAGYLVRMTACSAEPGGPSLATVRKGDVLRLESWYWVGPEPMGGRELAIPAGTHLNVMGYMLMVFSNTDQPDDPSGGGGESSSVVAIAVAAAVIAALLIVVGAVLAARQRRRSQHRYRAAAAAGVPAGSGDATPLGRRGFTELH